MPLRKQQTQQKLATLMGVSKTTVQCWIVASTICVHSNSLKPILTEVRDLQDPSKYQGMHDHRHLDEKWFFLTWEKEWYLLLLDEITEV